MGIGEARARLGSHLRSKSFSRQPANMVRRESWLPAVLTLVTCGVYYVYWQYITTEELKNATGREDLNPVTDLIITLVCCGFWSIYVQYRNAQIVHEVFVARGTPHEDKSTMVLLMHALTAVNGVTGLIAIMLLQDEYNKLADLGGGGGQPIAF